MTFENEQYLAAYIIRGNNKYLSITDWYGDLVFYNKVKNLKDAIQVMSQFADHWRQN